MINSNQSSIRPSLNKFLIRAIIGVSLIGVADTLYLILNSLYGDKVKCLLVGGCETVLTSKFSIFAGIPLSWWGLVFYVSVFLVINLFDIYSSRKWLKLLGLMSVAGFLVSVSLLYIQIFEIKALCFYCLTSFTTSTIIFILTLVLTQKYKRADNSNESVAGLS